MTPDKIKISLTINEVAPVNNRGVVNPQYPADGLCKSGHRVPGARFFMVTGPALPPERWGVYCECCIAAANALLEKKRKETTKDGD